MPRIAFVAAMEREVAPLVRNWQTRTLEERGRGGRRYRLFESGDAVVICGGMGVEAARRAATTVVSEARPSRIVSVGFAGALDRNLKVADVIEPRIVINAKDGSRAETTAGQGILVSNAYVATPDQKRKLRESYGASAVDMEAAGIAQAAQVYGLEFGALKAVSDETDFPMPPMEEFIASDGAFRLASFVPYVMLRPKWWGPTIRLARNSARASQALCVAMERYMNTTATSGVQH